MTFGKTFENYLDGLLRNFQTILLKDMMFDNYVRHRVWFLIHKNLKYKGLKVAEIIVSFVRVDIKNC